MFLDVNNLFQSRPSNFTPNPANLHSNYYAAPTDFVHSSIGDSWSQAIPHNMPFVPVHNPAIMRFSGQFPYRYNQPVISHDPCTSNTATEWELLNRFSSGVGTSNCNLHLKRRTSSSEEEDADVQPPPSKKYMNEDRVAARFDHLSISTQDAYIEDLSDEESKREEDELEKKGTIILSDEAAQILKSKDMVDKFLQKEYDNSCKAIVLWSPPIGTLPPELENLQNASKEEEEEEDSMMEKMIE